MANFIVVPPANVESGAIVSTTGAVLFSSTAEEPLLTGLPAGQTFRIGAISDLGTITTPAALAAPSFASGPTLSGVPENGEIQRVTWVPAGNPAPTAEFRWTIGGVLQIGLVDAAWVLSAPPSTPYYAEVRLTNSQGQTAWVATNTLTTAAATTDLALYMGADTKAGEGGADLPAGATSITNAGGTNLTVSGGLIVPASDGVNSGTITFNNGATLEVVAELNTRSVRTIQQLKAALEASDLTRGDKVWIRSGVVLNDLSARFDVQRTTPVGGTVGGGYVEVTGHPNEPRPVVRSIGLSPHATPANNEHPWEMHHIDWVGRIIADDEPGAADLLKTHIVNRSTNNTGFDDATSIRGVYIHDCTFGTPGTDDPTLYGKRWNGIDGSGPARFWRIENNIFDRVSFGIRAQESVQAIGNYITRWSRDAVQANCNGSVVMWNYIARGQTICEVWVDPVIVSQGATTVIRIPGAEMFTRSAASERNDGQFTLTAGDGPLAGLHGSRFAILSSTYLGTDVEIGWNSTGIDFGAVTSFTLRWSSWHHDYWQSSRVRLKEVRSPVNDVHPGFDAVFIGNIFDICDYPDAFLAQTIFLENQNGLDAARVLAMYNMGGGTPFHALKLADAGSLVAIRNVFTSFRPELNNVGIGATIGDGGTGQKEPHRSACIGNIASLFEFDPERQNTSIRRNIALNGTNNASFFTNYRFLPTVHAPLEATMRENCVVTPAVAATGIGAAGTGLVDYDARTFTWPVETYGARIAFSGAVATVSAEALYPGDTNYYAITAQTSLSLTPAQVKAGLATAGVVAAGSFTAPLDGSRGSVTVTGLAQGSYRVITAAERGAALSFDCDRSPITIYSTATVPTLDLRSISENSGTGNVRTHSAVAVNPSSHNLFALNVSRGGGNAASVTIGGESASRIARHINGENRTELWRLPNPGTDAAFDVVITGSSAATSASSLLTLLSMRDADVQQLIGLSPANGATSITQAIDVLPGDIVVVTFFRTGANFTNLSVTGATITYGPEQVGSAAHYAGIAQRVISTAQTGYEVTVACDNGFNNSSVGIVIFRNSAALAAPVAPAFTAGPTIVGTPAAGETLSVAYTLTGTEPMDVAVNWQVYNGSWITEATDQTFVVTPAMRGRQVRALVAATNAADTVAAASEPVTIDSGETHIFVVAGQSNAAGRAPNDGGALFPVGTVEYGSGDSWSAVGSRLYHGSWETLATASNFGFARQFAIDYQAANPNVTIGFIGVAHGGTGFQNGNWRPGDPSYNQAVARVNAAMAVAPEGAVLKGVLWHQGENDGQTTEAQNAYAGHLSAFIPAFRAAIGAPNIPFVLGGHAEGAQYYNHVTHRVIQAIPNIIARTGYAPADVPRNATLADAVHFDAASQRHLGSRFVEALAEAEANATLGGTAGITTGAMTRHNLAAGTSGAVTGVSLGTPAPGRLIVVGFQGRNSSINPYPIAATLAGVPLKRVAAANNGSGRNGTTLFYAVIPEGSTGDLSVTWSASVNASQAACFILPVYGARPHLAGTGAFNMIGGGNGYGVSITTSIDVLAGDLIIAISGAQQTTVPTGTLDLAVSQNGALGPNCTMVVGHEIAAAPGSRSVTCSFGGVVVNNPTLTVMALKAQ